jgi:drug/metabolite transporter (DMT)-like permease
MSLGRRTTRLPFDPLMTALGVFVVLGLVLTAVGGYAVYQTVGTASSVTVSPALLVSFVFGLLLVATAVGVRRAVPDPNRH